MHGQNKKMQVILNIISGKYTNVDTLSTLNMEDKTPS